MSDVSESLQSVEEVPELSFAGDALQGGNSGICR